jgi:hypothetical protein
MRETKPLLLHTSSSRDVKLNAEKLSCGLFKQAVISSDYTVKYKNEIGASGSVDG